MEILNYFLVLNRGISLKSFESDDNKEKINIARNFSALEVTYIDVK